MRAHEALYTYSLPDQDVVLVNARASVIGRLPRAVWPCGDGGAAAGVDRSRRRGCGWAGGRRCRCSTSRRWEPDQALAGPAIVESDTTTVLLRAGDMARFDMRAAGWI